MHPLAQTLLKEGMGAIFAQVDKQSLFHVVSYGSCQLVKHEKNYSPHLLEMSPVVWGISFYDEYVREKHFTLYMDYKWLVKFGHLNNKTLNYLQLAMLENDFQIQYKKGDNMPFDFLSHTQIDEVAAIQNVKATAAVIDPFTPTLAEEKKLIQT